MLKSIVTSIITILACQFARVELFGPKAGPYQIVMHQFEECKDTGTHQLVFGTKINSKGNNTYTYTADVLTEYPWDEYGRLDIEVQQLSNGVYRPRFITQTFKNCEEVEKIGILWLKSFFGAAGYEYKGCPLPAGPYDIVVRQFEECEDTGTHQVAFGSKMNSRGNNIYTYTTDIITDYAWDDNFKLDIEVQRLSNGLYRPRFITHTFKSCKKFEKVGNEFMKSLLGAAGYNFKGCPVPAGNYSVKDWPVELKFTNIPTLMYMSFKMISTLYHTGTKIGCAVAWGDVIPKST